MNSNKTDIQKALLMPAVLGYVSALKTLWIRRDRRSLNIYLFLYTIILAYWYPNYDTMGRFAKTLKQIDHTNILEGDFLMNLIALLNPIIDAYYLFALVWFCGLLFFCNACITAYGREDRFSSVLLIILVFGVNACYIGSLTYYTAAATFSLYIFQRYSNKYIVYLPLLYIAYLIHPGILMVVPGALCLQFLFHRNYNLMAIIFVIIYFILFNRIMNGSFSFFAEIIQDENMDAVLNGYNAYTSEDSVWGKNFQDFGKKGILWDFLLYAYYIFVAVLSFANFSLVKRHFAFACYVIGLIVLINVYGFYTMTERVTIITYLSGLLVLSKIVSTKQVLKFVNSTIIFFVLCLYFLSLLLFPQPRRHFFKDPLDSYLISSMTLVVPNIFTTIDLHHLGFSDDYLDENNVGGVFKRNIIR